MSRFSKVSSIFGRDAFATMRYVTLLNVSEIRDISNDERKVPFKNDDTLLNRDFEFSEGHVNHPSETTKFRNHCKNKMRQGNYYSSLMAEVILWWLQNAI